MLFLSACNDDPEEDLSKSESFVYPKAVENEIISPEMYWQIRRFFKDTNTYASPEYEYKISILNMLESDYNADLINSYNDHLTEREAMLANQAISPVTEVDEMFAGYMEKYIYHSNKNIKHMRDFTKDFDFSYNDMAVIESKWAQNYMEDILELLTAYGLLGETVE